MGVAARYAVAVNCSAKWRANYWNCFGTLTADQSHPNCTSGCTLGSLCDKYDSNVEKGHSGKIAVRMPGVLLSMQHATPTRSVMFANMPCSRT